MLLLMYTYIIFFTIHTGDKIMIKLLLLLFSLVFFNIPDICALQILVSGGKPVTANNYYSTYEPSYLTDGTVNTCWLNPSYSGWATVDLQQPVKISQVTFYDLVSSGSSTLSLYIDNNFIETKTLSLSGGVITPFNFDVPDITGQYVKMNITNSASWVEGHEFEIYTTAVPEPATCIMFFLGIFLNFIRKKGE